jgi:hypothetical protein
MVPLIGDQGIGEQDSRKIAPAGSFIACDDGKISGAVQLKTNAVISALQARKIGGGKRIRKLGDRKL